MRYAPSVPLALHSLLASTNVHKIQYPRSLYEARQKLEKSVGILCSVVEGAGAGTSRRSLVLHTLPLLAAVLRPGFRPVNAQLYSAKERQELEELVGVMIQFNLTYRQQRSLEGQYVFVLEPDVDELVEFPGVEKLRSRGQLTYATKQMVAREVEMEKVRRADAATRHRDEPRPHTTATPAPTLVKPTTNHLQRITAPLNAPPEASETTRKPYFIIKPKEGAQVAAPKDRTGLWFKYKAGYSNAVRRTIKMKEFL